MAFKYLHDPLFLVCIGLYLLNRFVFKPAWSSGFVHDHFNDLICIPFVVPPMVWVQRRLRLRAHDSSPLWYELLIPIVVLSLVFEIVLPVLRLPGTPAVADHRDIFFYVLGGFVAGLWWEHAYRRPSGSVRE